MRTLVYLCMKVYKCERTDLWCSVWRCVAVCCSVLQRAALGPLRMLHYGVMLKLYACMGIHGSRTHTLQHNATCCNVLQHTATCYSTLQHAATHSSTQQHSATLYNTLQYAATHSNETSVYCSTQQPPVTHCNTLQHTATQCNTLHC